MTWIELELNKHFHFKRFVSIPAKSHEYDNKNIFKEIRKMRMCKADAAPSIDGVTVGIGKLVELSNKKYK